MSERKGFVKSILARLFRQSDDARREKIRMLVRTAASLSSGTQLSPKEKKCREELLELILPQIMQYRDDDQIEVGSTKEWAFALAQSIGLLAALGTDPRDRERAIEEITKEIKGWAKMSDSYLKPSVVTRADKKTGLPNPKQSEERKKEKVAPYNGDAKASMIADLRRQMETETDEGMKAALHEMIKAIESPSGGGH